MFYSLEEVQVAMEKSQGMDNKGMERDWAFEKT